MAAKRAKKKAGARARPAKRRSALPVVEVDVDDEAALGAIAEQMAAAIVAAMIEKASRSPAKKAPKKRKRAAKSR